MNGFQAVRWATAAVLAVPVGTIFWGELLYLAFSVVFWFGGWLAARRLRDDPMNAGEEVR